MSGRDDPSRRWLIWAFWLVGFGLLYVWIDGWYGRMLNPNTAETLARQAGELRGEVRLERSHGGGYRAEGELNGTRVVFLVDTGADSVAVSTRTAERLGLKRGAAIGVTTAGGNTTGYETRIDRVKIGAIELADVRAIIVDGMADDLVLLGMTFLRRVEFSQRDGVLTLRR